MTLIERREFDLKCNAGTYGAWCQNVFRTTEREYWHAQRLAREAGWVTLGMNDFCPEHATPQARQRAQDDGVESGRAAFRATMDEINDSRRGSDG